MDVSIIAHFLARRRFEERTKEKPGYLCPKSGNNNQLRTTSIVQSQYVTFGKETCLRRDSVK